MEYNNLSFQYVWKQSKIPVILFRIGKGERARVRIPYRENNKSFILNKRPRRFLEWNSSQKYWELPRSWTQDLLERLLETFGKCYWVQEYNKSEICSAACLKAKGAECQCSCCGKNHGSESVDTDKIFELSISFAIIHKGKDVSIRLFERK